MADDKMKSKLQVPLRLDMDKDEYIYEMVYLSDDRTNLIKNALFYYLHDIELGKVVDRNFPYGKITSVPFQNQYTEESSHETKFTRKEFPTDTEELGKEFMEKYLDEEEDYEDDDNMDDLDI